MLSLVAVFLGDLLQKQGCCCQVYLVGWACPCFVQGISCNTEILYYVDSIPSSNPLPPFMGNDFFFSVCMKKLYTMLAKLAVSVEKK